MFNELSKVDAQGFKVMANTRGVIWKTIQSHVDIHACKFTIQLSCGMENLCCAFCVELSELSLCAFLGCILFVLDLHFEQGDWTFKSYWV